MTVEIKLLADVPHLVPALATMWYEELGKTWIPHASVQRAVETYEAHLNHDTLPLTYVAVKADQALGMVSLRDNDGIRDDLTPWLGSLIVDPKHRRQGLGAQLIDVAKVHIKAEHLAKLYLFVLDPALPDWYQRLGWRAIGQDKLYHHPVTVMETSL